MLLFTIENIIIGVAVWFVFCVIVPSVVSVRIRKRSVEENEKISAELIEIWDNIFDVLYYIENNVKVPEREPYVSPINRQQNEGSKAFNEKKMARIEFKKLDISKKSSQVKNIIAKIHAGFDEKNKKVREEADSMRALAWDKERKIEEKVKQHQKIYAEITKAFPFVANAVADYEATLIENSEQYLRNKSHPAYSTADIVKQAKEKARTAIKERKIFEYKIKFYENSFPWLVDYFDVPLEPDYAEAVRNEVEAIPRDKASDLSREEKFQLYLDHYWSRQKSNWEIGRDYERYVGYRYEMDGWTVSYWGAIKGFEDMGRDLIAEKDGLKEIIQCKRWAADKVIREKHIFQLFGTTLQYAMETGQNIGSWEDYAKMVSSGIITPVFITSTVLSPIAAGAAQALGIKVRENYKMGKYPCIKCHAKTSSGDKIYHLPYDQQYDSIKMDFTAGDCYAATISDAEKAGFRRAKMWVGN